MSTMCFVHVPVVGSALCSDVGVVALSGLFYLVKRLADVRLHVYPTALRLLLLGKVSLSYICKTL